MKVEVAVLGSPSLTVRTVSVDVKQHWAPTQADCRTVRKVRKISLLMHACFSSPIISL